MISVSRGSLVGVIPAASVAGASGVFAVTSGGRSSAAQSTSPFPLVTSSNGRYLVDQTGKPFLIIGDSPQGLLVNGSPTQADQNNVQQYLSARQGQKFNTLWLNVLANNYTGGYGTDGTQGALTANYGKTYDGIVPFTGTVAGGQYDLTTPNSAYWSRIDTLLNLVASYGFAMILDPIETGGWLSTIKANGSGTSSKNYAYGQWLANRYRSLPNIIWMSGNDYSWNSTDDPYVLSVHQGILSVTPPAGASSWLTSVEFNEVSVPVSSFTDSAWRSYISLDGTYTYPNGGATSWTYDTILTDYNRADFLPVFLAESYYEGEHSITAKQLRMQAWWAALSGSTGQMFGETYTSFFRTVSGPGWATTSNTGGANTTNWWSQLSTTGAVEMTNLASLLSARAWHTLVPDQAPRTLITAGGGTYDTDAYVTAAASADGHLALAYLPSGGTVTVSMAGFASSVTARWYDPCNGTFTAISGSPFAASGSQSLTAPASNHDGDPDWVLLLEA